VQKKIIRKLNQLNNKFYQSVADDFSESRQYFWQGWEKITEYLEKNHRKIKILDIACGNARFAQFLKEKKVDFTYSGLDNSQQLIKIARETIKKGKHHWTNN
jgi:2-polyprenyl-3-methyl-5-hydroxy-6-metoxy-1,4-benzoquinol methylase